jgi:cytochrome c oxidase subunit II
MRESSTKAVAMVCTTALAACDGPQSSLNPAGPAAQSIHILGLWMYAGALLVVALVSILVLVPFVRLNRRRTPIGLFLWGGGIVLPSVTLMTLLPFVFTTGSHQRGTSEAAKLTVEITGHLYWWEIRYRRPGLSDVGSANELRIPVGEPVELLLTSADVIHSFWVPALAGKTDMIPGVTNRMMIEASRTGQWRGQCAEFCGLQHAQMALYVIAEPRADFDRWLSSNAKPVASAENPLERQGEQLYVSLGCAACHAMRGVSEARVGPDLTTVGGRQTIGAGLLPTSVGNIAGWIASTQHLKPGVNMPSFNRINGPELRALAAYLEGRR